MQVIETRIGVRILVVALLIAIEGLAEAKLIAIQLEELVRQSAFIAYGKTVHQYEPGGDSTVLFAPAQILKGAAGINRPIRLCNSPRDVESFDLRKVSADYVVFAAPSGPCFRPIYGISSVIQVESQVAKTLSIAGEPESQPLEVFVSKIRLIVKAQPSDSTSKP